MRAHGAAVPRLVYNFRACGRPCTAPAAPTLGGTSRMALSGIYGLLAERVVSAVYGGAGLPYVPRPRATAAPPCHGCDGDGMTSAGTVRGTPAAGNMRQRCMRCNLRCDCGLVTGTITVAWGIVAWGTNPSRTRITHTALPARPHRYAGTTRRSTKIGN